LSLEGLTSPSRLSAAPESQRATRASLTGSGVGTRGVRDPAVDLASRGSCTGECATEMTYDGRSQPG
jgi:hypothetical protein